MKQPRLGQRLLEAARSEHFFAQTHAVFGGTGAVGGATVLQLIGLFEEALARHGAGACPQPRLVITGRTKQELRQFTSRLFRIQQRDHDAKPEHRPEVGYRTVGGVRIELRLFGVDPVSPDLAGLARSSPEDRRQRLQILLEKSDRSLEAPLADQLEVLRREVTERVGRPYTQFLKQYLEERGLHEGTTRFQSVVVAIPLASVATYGLRDIEVAAETMGLSPDAESLTELKEAYLESVRDDLALVADSMAHEVLVAHTTAVGGMYDEEAHGRRVIRLGFAHSALGDRLRQKQLFADKLTQLYAEKGIKMLITAAAIGIDGIQLHKSPPWNGAVRTALAAARARGEEVVPEPDLRTMHVYAPAELEVDSSPSEPKALRFEHGIPLTLNHVIRSGENGFFSVSNADALYRVMRVTSSSELGLQMARTALLGDEEGAPQFPDNVCYFTETDNSRQVFDLLAQPELRATQLSGLQPKALQDLGSAKHQAELHLLGLLILLHRLKTLNLDALPPHLRLADFDAQGFFESHSQVLALEHLATWDLDLLSRELALLARARTERDLGPLKHFFQADPERQEAAHRILQAVLRAVWTIPSLGSPLLFEHEGRRRALVGPYVAPLDRVIAHENELFDHLHTEFERTASDGAFEAFVEYHIANLGFVDLRPVAVLVTTRSIADGLQGRVQVFRDEADFVAALEALPPYEYFTTSGLIALLYRLRQLWQASRQLQLELGSDNSWRAHLLRDDAGRTPLVPGVIEAFRMVSEGLEKNTGFERLDGSWGYRPR